MIFWLYLIFGFVGAILLYRIWQLTIEKNTLLSELQNKQLSLEEKNTIIQRFSEKVNLSQHLDSINQKLGLIEHLSGNISSLQHIFGSKQHRGLFGEHKLIDILHDELSANQYEVQYILNNATRPDAVIYLPSEPKLLAIDAKFPFESFRSIQEAEKNNEKQHLELYHKAFISDMKKHIKDISSKYIVPEQTQEFALLFIPAESIYNYICHKCPQIAHQAAQANVILCTPNILMLVIHIIKSLTKNYQTQVHARAIQAEMLKITNDVINLRERNKKLQRHIEQSLEDLESIDKLTIKLDKNIDKLTNIEFENKADILLDYNIN